MLIYRYKQKKAEPKRPASPYLSRMTKAELKEKLDELGIKYKANDTKDVLISLLQGGD